MLKKFFIFISLAILAACSSSPRQGASINSSSVNPAVDERDDSQLTTFIGGLKTNRQDHALRNTKAFSGKAKELAKVYNEWAGTRYRLGGTTRGGIDCSGFVRQAFASAYGMSLPRSTAQQRYLGHKVQKNELKQGDLVFFRGNNHVGVYIGNNQFIHSSTSQGVTISSLNDKYWSRTYTQSRRIL